MVVGLTAEERARAGASAAGVGGCWPPVAGWRWPRKGRAAPAASSPCPTARAGGGPQRERQREGAAYLNLGRPSTAVRCRLPH
jgi:hypothetical protein